MDKVIGEKSGVKLVLGEFQGLPVLRRETADGRILAAVGIRPEYLGSLIDALQQLQGQLQATKQATRQANKPTKKAKATPVLATTNTAETAEDVRVLLRQVLKRLGGGA
jgi:hypothetical protein